MLDVIQKSCRWGVVLGRVARSERQPAVPFPGCFVIPSKVANPHVQIFFLCHFSQMIQKAITIRQPFAWLIVHGFKPSKTGQRMKRGGRFAGRSPYTLLRHRCRIRSMTGAARSSAEKSRGMNCTSAASSASLNYLKQVVQWAFWLGASERKADTFPVVPRTVGTLDPTDAAAPPTGLGALRRDVCSLPFVPVRIFLITRTFPKYSRNAVANCWNSNATALGVGCSGLVLKLGVALD